MDIDSAVRELESQIKAITNVTSIKTCEMAIDSLIKYDGLLNDCACLSNENELLREENEKLKVKHLKDIKRIEESNITLGNSLELIYELQDKVKMLEENQKVNREE